MTNHSPTSTSGEPPHLERQLSNRHIQLIAIGGAIGTGLFMGSGKTISAAGPSVIFVYMIIGFMLFFVMRAMGELLLSNLNYKSFSDFAADLLGPILHRLDLLVLLGDHRNRRRHCNRRLLPRTLAGPAALDTRPGHGGHPPAAEPCHRQGIR